MAVAKAKIRVGGLWVNIPGDSREATVRTATTASVTIATALNPGDTIDGVTLADGDLVLVRLQASTAQNGIYLVGTTPRRAPQFDAFDDHAGARIMAQEGATNADTMWIGTANLGGTLDTTAITFVNSAFLTKGNGVFNVKAFGARGDGTTNDRAAIQACIDAAGAGSTVYFPPGTYMVSVHTSFSCLHIPYPRMTLLGAQGHDSSVIKLVNAAGDYYAVITDQPIAGAITSTTDVSGFRMLYLTLDQNASNNPISDVGPSGPLYGGVRPRLGVRVYRGSDGLIEDCHFTNFDNINTIILSGGPELTGSNINHWTIRQCKFDGIGAGTAHDHSTIYYHGDDIKVLNCTFVGAGPAAICAIELHGNSQLVDGNRVENMYCMTNITGAANESKNQRIINNIGIRMGTGIQLWARLYPNVRVATTANITIATDLNVGDIIDGISAPGLLDGDLVLVKNQTNPAENGIYVAGATPARAARYDTWAELVGATITVNQGTVEGRQTYVCTVAPGGTLNTTAVTFAVQHVPALQHVVVDNNHIEIDYDSWPGGYRTGIFVDSGSDSVCSDIKITKNQISYRPFFNTTISNDQYSAGILWFRQALIKWNAANKETGIEISGNVIENPICTGIYYRPYVFTQGVLIERNRIVNPGVSAMAAALRTGVFLLVANQPADGLGNATTPAVEGWDITIRNNEVVDKRATHLVASAVDVSFNSAPIVRGRITGNTLICHDGTNLPVHVGHASIAWYGSHVMDVYAAPTGVWTAGSTVLETSTGTTRKQTAAPSGSTWSVVDNLPPDVQQFTATGTWTKPAGAVAVEVHLIGGGGGGGSGRRGAAGTVCGGGGSGAGGMFVRRTFKASDLTGTVAVTIGANGTGGAAAAADSTSGVAGTVGGLTTFGGYLTALYGLPGGGGTTTGGSAPVSLLTSTAVPSAGGGGAGGTGAVGTTTGANLIGAGAGAGGGGIDAANVAYNGGTASGSWLSVTTGGTAGVVGAASPGTGTAPGPAGSPGPGGGGGAASASVAAQAGATPLGFGGGGGGGGASRDGNASGAGGNGAPGVALIITYF